MRFASIPLASALLTLRLPCSESSVTLDEDFLEIASTAVRLSALAYETNLTDFSTGEGTWSHPDYDEFMVYTEEPDQALLVAVDGKCFVAFRGTNANLADCKWNKLAVGIKTLNSCRIIELALLKANVVLNIDTSQGNKTSISKSVKFTRTEMKRCRPVWFGRDLPISYSLR